MVWPTLGSRTAKNRTKLEATSKGKERRGIGTEWEGGERDEEGKIPCHTIFV